MSVKSFRTFLLVLIVLLIVSCASPAQPHRDCNELSLIEDLRAEMFKPIEFEELRHWIIETYNLGLNDVKVSKYGDLSSLGWQKDGITYVLTIQDSVPYDARIGFATYRPSFGEALKCLGWGNPDYYWAFFGDEIPYGKAYTVDLYFVEKGALLASGKHFITHSSVKSPPLDANLPVDVLIFVKSGSLEEVYSRVNHGISLDSREPAEQPKPWPGSWSNLKYVTRTDGYYDRTP